MASPHLGEHTVRQSVMGHYKNRDLQCSVRTGIVPNQAPHDCTDEFTTPSGPDHPTNSRNHPMMLGQQCAASDEAAIVFNVPVGRTHVVEHMQVAVERTRAAEHMQVAVERHHAAEHMHAVERSHGVEHTQVDVDRTHAAEHSQVDVERSHAAEHTRVDVIDRMECRR